jgi:hypothetical protein
MAKQNETTKKQPYAPPTLTNHGDVVKQTKGIFGRHWETIGSNTGDDGPPIRDWSPTR